MVSILCCVLLWNGGGVRCCWSAWPDVCGLRHLLPVRTAEYCCRVMLLLSVGCVVCGGAWWGVLCLLPPPHVGGGWGRCGWVGGIVVVGGIVNEGRLL